VPAVCEGNACRLTDIAGDRSDCPTELETPNYRKLRCFGVMLVFLSSHAATRENAESSHDCGYSVPEKYRSKLRRFRNLGQVFRRPCDRGGVLRGVASAHGGWKFCAARECEAPAEQTSRRANVPPSKRPAEQTSRRANLPPSKSPPVAHRIFDLPAERMPRSVLDRSVQQNEDYALLYDYFAT
jgi:hypothetical protein